MSQKLTASESLVGRRVKITWEDPAADWHFFIVRDVRPERGLLTLQGATDPAGNRHAGDTFIAHVSQVKKLKKIDTDEEY